MTLNESPQFLFLLLGGIVYIRYILVCLKDTSGLSCTYSLTSNRETLGARCLAKCTICCSLTCEIRENELSQGVELRARCSNCSFSLDR
ncbi:hypothetical protein BDZ91DRAFT_730528 [Kalaharituber pfeilii]|nr:hypothetical protein BDZ91DRAFT_730528 [Kalaharituber pfeilii]